MKKTNDERWEEKERETTSMKCHSLKKPLSFAIFCEKEEENYLTLFLLSMVSIRKCNVKKDLNLLDTHFTFMLANPKKLNVTNSVTNKA